MRRFAGNGSAPVGADKTMFNLHAATTVRPRINFLTLGCAATPADLAGLFHVQRTTTKGTGGTEVTAVPCSHPGELASLATYTPGEGVAFGAEPTYTAGAIFLAIPLHQRNTFSWYCNAPGQEFVAPATANNGIGVKASTNGGTAIHMTSVLWLE